MGINGSLKYPHMVGDDRRCACPPHKRYYQKQKPTHQPFQPLESVPHHSAPLKTTLYPLTSLFPSHPKDIQKPPNDLEQPQQSMKQLLRPRNSFPLSYKHQPEVQTFEFNRHLLYSIAVGRGVLTYALS